MNFDSFRKLKNAYQSELTQKLIILSHLTLSLMYTYLYLGLSVGSSREYLTLPRRYGRIPGDQLGENAAERLNAERQRRDIEQQYVRNITGQDCALYSGTDGYGFVRIHRFARLLAKYILHGLLYFRHASHAADQKDFVHFASVNFGVFQRFQTRVDCSLNQRSDDVLELSTREFVVHVLRATLVDGQVWQIDFGLH